MQFLGNYKTILGEEGVYEKAIENDLEEGLVSGAFSESEHMGEIPKVLFNSLGGLKISIDPMSGR